MCLDSFVPELSSLMQLSCITKEATVDCGTHALPAAAAAAAAAAALSLISQLDMTEQISSCRKTVLLTTLY